MQGDSGLKILEFMGRVNTHFIASSKFSGGGVGTACQYRCSLVFTPLSLNQLSLTVSVITKMTAPASAQDASNMIKVCSLEAIEHMSR
jgi:hypothetical protein